MYGGNGSSGNQTITQQNLPDWALNYAQQNLDMANQYTMNPNYRPSTLSKDFSGIRGYNAQGQPNSQVGQFGLNPTPAQPDPELVTETPLGGGFFGGLFGGAMGTPVSVNAMPRSSSRGMGRVDTTNSAGTEGATEYESEGGYTGPGWDFDGDGKGYYYDGDGANNSSDSSSSDSSSSDSSNSTNTTTTTTSTGETEPAYQFDPTQMTPFAAYDRQRFAAPNANTLTGEGLMAGRYADRFGPSGSNPFASAISSAQQVANYGSRFTPAAIDISGPKANSYSNVNAGLRSATFGNANQNLQGPINYQGQRSFQQNLSQFENPYTSQVVDQTIKDLDRARRITDMDISSNAAKQGAFGGSREALMRSENARNFADRTAAAVGQLRSQGFQKAADLAQQEQLQRLGLTAQDLQNVRGYASQGNLQGQNLTAQDLQNVRGLISQGGLAAQTLGAQSDRDAMGFQNQLQMQGNQLLSDYAKAEEQFRQGAGALNLQGAGALGNLQQMSIADERQRLADMLAAGAGQSARDQQDLDFIYSEFNRELDYPGRQIDLRNSAISPATGSIVQTTQPRYQSNPLLGAAGAGLSAYGMTQNPYAAGGAALLSLLYG